MKKSIVFLAFAFCLLGHAIAERPQFEFKGYKPGDPAGDLSTFASWLCKPQQSDKSATMCVTSKETIAGFPVTMLAISIKDGLIKSVSVTFKSENFEQVSEAMRAKYGPPDTATEHLLQNRMGAKFMDVRLRWASIDPETGGPYMSLRKYTSDVTQSSLFITHLPKSEAMKQQREQDTKQRSEDL